MMPVERVIHILVKAFRAKRSDKRLSNPAEIFCGTTGGTYSAIEIIKNKVDRPLHYLYCSLIRYTLFLYYIPSPVTTDRLLG